MKKKRARCWNCKHASDQFKVLKLTHVHCMKPEYQEQADKGDPPSPWETLRVFSDSCESHAFKNENYPNEKE